MGLGAVIKVAMDASAVKRGVQGIKSMFSRLGGTIRGFGSIMRRSLKVGAGAGLAAGGALAASIKSTARFGQELRTIERQTGMSARKVIALKQAFKLAGIEMDDVGDLLSDFNERIEDMARGGGTGGEGLEVLGLGKKRMQLLDAESRFLEVMRAAQDPARSVEELNFALDKLFGGQGFRLVSLARNFDEFMIMAEKDTERLGEVLNENMIDKLVETERSMQKLGVAFRTIMTQFVTALPFDKIADFINNTLPGVMKGIQEFLVSPGEKIAGLGQKIAEGFVQVLRDSMRELGKLFKEGMVGEGGIFNLKGLFGGGTASAPVDVSGKIDRTNQLLSDIKRGGAVFA